MTRARGAEVPRRCVTPAAEMTDRGMTATATTSAEVASTAPTTAGVTSTAPTTAGVTSTAPTTATMTAAAAMLSHGGRRHGHCRCQHTRRQEEVPTLDTHDCLRNLSRGTIALGAL
jgi:hypothetical protein